MAEFLLDDSWVYGQLRHYRLGSRGSEVDLASVYHERPGVPAQPAPVRLPRHTCHLAAVRRYLPQRHGDALSYAHGLLLGVVERLYPTTPHSRTDDWPLPLQLFTWPYAEWLLHAETQHPQYRDHIVHCLRVAALGRWLIDVADWARHGPGVTTGPLAKAVASAPNVRRLLDALNLRTSAVTDWTVLAAWWVAALFHDIGYSVQLFGQVERLVATALPWYVGDVASGLVRGCSRDLMRRSLLLPYLEHFVPHPPHWSSRRDAWEIGLYTESLGNHSVAGALMLLMSLDEAKDLSPYVCPQLELVFQLAAEAVLYHDLLPSKQLKSGDKPTCRLAWGTVDPSSDPSAVQCPIGAILALCDALQTWGRLRLQPVSTSTGVRALCEEGVQESLTVEFTVGTPCTLGVDRGVYLGEPGLGGGMGHLVSDGIVDFGDRLAVGPLGDSTPA